MAREDYARASLQFSNAVQLFPKDAEAVYELGLAYLADGKLNPGVAAVFRATQLDPKLDTARIKLAELMARSGDNALAKESEKQMRELLAATPGNIAALNALALAEIQLGESENAESHLQAALSALPSSLSSSVQLARLYLLEHDARRAEEALKQAAAAAPRSAQAAAMLGSFYVLTGNWTEAQSEFRSALGITPNDPNILLPLANIDLQLGDKEEAKQIFRKLSASPDPRFKHFYAAYLFVDGQHDAGIKEFQKLASNAPRDGAPRKRLVAAYILAGRATEAEKVIAAALKENPNDAVSRLQRSQLLLRSGKDHEAEAELNQVLHFKPGSADAHYLLAQIYGLRGDRSAQTAELDATLHHDPGFEAARASLAQFLTLSGSPQAALELLEAAPEGQKKSLGLLLQRNMAFYAIGDKKAFRDGVARAMQLARTPDVLMQDAVVKLMDRNYADARASIEEVLQRNPDNLRALQAKVFSFTAQKQNAEAERFLTTYAAQSKSAAVQEYLGEWLWSAGKHEQGRASLVRSMSIDPHFVPAYVALAEVNIAEGSLDPARSTLTQVLAMDPHNFAGRVLLARLETMAARYPEALDHYRKALELQPRNFLVLNNLAYLLADKTDQLDEALPYAKRAAELAPENPDSSGTLGWILYRKGQYQDAKGYLKSAVSKDRDSRQENAVTRKYHLGLTYMKLGDKKEGREILERALQQNPGLPEAAIAQVALHDEKKPF